MKICFDLLSEIRYWAGTGSWRASHAFRWLLCVNNPPTAKPVVTRDVDSVSAPDKLALPSCSGQQRTKFIGLGTSFPFMHSERKKNQSFLFILPIYQWKRRNAWLFPIVRGQLKKSWNSSEIFHVLVEEWLISSVVNASLRVVMNQW